MKGKRHKTVSRKAAKSAKKDESTLFQKKQTVSLLHLPFLADLASWREIVPFLVRKREKCILTQSRKKCKEGTRE
ncbi:MAG: hypothetical protein MZV70_45040 [Desulfobacterales bacterium]|nr:hypothetical protein [Desulfobacterales bacterium]